MGKKYMVSKAYTTMKIWHVEEAENSKDANKANIIVIFLNILKVNHFYSISILRQLT